MATHNQIHAQRVLLTEDFVGPLTADRPIHQRGSWPAKWVNIDPTPHAPFITAYRCCFTLPQPTSFRMHASADERYDLYIDGQQIGRGPERGDGLNWFYQSYDISLDAGDHTLVAIVQRLGHLSPEAQLSVKHGLLVAAENLDAGVLNTGHATWHAKLLTGLHFEHSNVTFGVGSYTRMTGSKMCWGIERGEGEGWSPVAVNWDARSTTGWRDWGFGPPMLRPSVLPAMREADCYVGSVRHIDNATEADHIGVRVKAANDLCNEHACWNALLAGTATLKIQPHTQRRVIIDLGDYYCAYPTLQVAGGRGAVVNWRWAESLFAEIAKQSDHSVKHNRDDIENKIFSGVGDWFEPDGESGRVFRPHWWRAGRYLQVIITTSDQPLTIERMYLRQTGYPLNDEGNFDCSDSRYRAVWPVMVRVMQMCSHEHYMDCPYYEQLMYVGDSRLEALATYCMTTDARLPRKAVEVFGFSRLANGLTQSRYPSRGKQIIAPFSLWWVGMVYDHALWRGDEAFIRRMMAGVHSVLDAYALKLNDEDLLEPHDGWNFVDWVHGWDRGSPPGGETEPTATITMQFVRALQHAAELEQWLGESAMAQRWNELARRVFNAALKTYFDDARGLFAESADHQVFTEHAQCLALLTNLLTSEQADRVFAAWRDAKDLAPCSIYFSHYVFEMLRNMRRTDLLPDRMKLWFDLPGQGFKTTVEAPEPSRSDCHAWGAHPIYHAYATLLGIRPGSFGFDTVRIEPQLGVLEHAAGTLPHPKGKISVQLRQAGGKLNGSIDLPAGLTGTLAMGGREIPLAGGRTEI